MRPTIANFRATAQTVRQSAVRRRGPAVRAMLCLAVPLLIGLLTVPDFSKKPLERLRQDALKPTLALDLFSDGHQFANLADRHFCKRFVGKLCGIGETRNRHGEIFGIVESISARELIHPIGDAERLPW